LCLVKKVTIKTKIRKFCTQADTPHLALLLLFNLSRKKNQNKLSFLAGLNKLRVFISLN